MFLHWRANLADQNKQQPLKINIRVTYHTVLSVWNKPLIDTCQHCSTSRANQALRSLANAGFQNRGVCLQAFPSFLSRSPHFHFLALVSFLARPKPRIPFLGLSLLRNQTETLATQAKLFNTMVTHNNWTRLLVYLNSLKNNCPINLFFFLLYYSYLQLFQWTNSTIKHSTFFVTAKQKTSDWNIHHHHQVSSRQ